MTDKNLIEQLRALKEIKPSQEWVVLTKENLFKEEPKFTLIGFIKELRRGERFVFNHKPAFAAVFSAVIFIGLFGFAQNSVPGDSLFPLKKITEKGQAVLVSGKDKPRHDLEMVNKRLNDLTKIASLNGDVQPAIREYKNSAEEAAKSIKEAGNIEEIAGEIKKLAENEAIVRSLGVETGETEELENALAELIEREIKTLERTFLTVEESEMLAVAKELFEKEEYSKALEQILEIGK
ncbi:MAG: hypothetical protein A2365_00720 [Candidatus Nealsonbacteria bacterium RIFOXYB1_FULL_40_15]|uniref:DUF5667 domain-containing protein n=2 Tax=Candidatus Nealsoniibacteriota TaxID=1817911 RepID=A0A1G2ETF1_9BACT|nr:MAG: hypothetical protein A2365_00720 [Candidatus Nealsonbacteria bacterium RIFOXYB1_FULL_40_15]OGZ28511.1 MAG: hypothetical protein A2562_03410 [Candidatus Nealsonbacteria bacterium RIFOXYD1_FULL_39_11]OGZ28792.1 MAG: hypothetical protein A2427_01905 [Candidatus Nealsonbacteria bacterium RIFOXYC1_FULL_40_7]